ncbi:hypothetical protein, partial [uncultured Muribaculum sp.]|uniref:hypothetical protein n=1 Tax=uncultured Muribaculum sp. TaxID=1918613 RepID=UPI002603187F
SDLHVPNVARCQLCYTPMAFATAKISKYLAAAKTFFKFIAPFLSKNPKKILILSILHFLNYSVISFVKHANTVFHRYGKIK